MAALIPFESLVELDALVVLEADCEVLQFGAQPVTFQWHDAGGDRRYTPDLLVVTALGCTFREVKPARRLARDPTLRGRRRRIEAECAARGADFEVWTDKEIRREPRLSNSRAVLSEGRRVGDAWAEERVRAAMPNCATVGELAWAGGLPPVRALRAVMRLAALGEAGLDLDAPLGPSTRILAGASR
ncbi:TnsA endonuclease N-terminal domain-containing protein [Methylobacterium sp. JK268]